MSSRTTRTSRRIAATASVVSLENEAGTVAARAGRCQICLQRAAVEAVARDAGEPRDELGRPPARHARGDELGDGRERAPSSVGARASGAGPITSVISPFGGSANRAASSAAVPRDDLLEALRQLAADGDLAARDRRPRASAASPAAASATRTRPPATGHAASSSQSAASAFSPRGRKPRNW